VVSLRVKSYFEFGGFGTGSGDPTREGKPTMRLAGATLPTAMTAAKRKKCRATSLSMPCEWVRFGCSNSGLSTLQVST
jgi:hypothetical protein